MSMENNNSLILTISSNIRKYRKYEGFSQLQLANLINSSQSHIGEIETAKKTPSIQLLQEIAKALKIRPYQLLIDVDRDILKDEKNKIRDELSNELKSAVDKYFNKI